MTAAAGNATLAPFRRSCVARITQFIYFSSSYRSPMADSGVEARRETPWGGAHAAARDVGADG